MPAPTSPGAAGRRRRIPDAHPAPSAIMALTLALSLSLSLPLQARPGDGGPDRSPSLSRPPAPLAEGFAGMADPADREPRGSRPRSPVPQHGAGPAPVPLPGTSAPPGTASAGPPPAGTGGPEAEADPGREPVPQGLFPIFRPAMVAPCAPAGAQSGPFGRAWEGTVPLPPGMRIPPNGTAEEILEAFLR
ncbi:MAG: hypothetical protein LBQ79_08405, partial [Deltaproteobacteria bacterium]|nr:hypothetical protein [Deltaproteobacteria bacterium]